MTIRRPAGAGGVSTFAITTRSPDDSSPRSDCISGSAFCAGTSKCTIPANWPARFVIRLPAQLAPKPCARSDSRLTMPGRSLPIAVTISDVPTTPALLGQRHGAADHRRLRREALVLRLRRQLAVLRRVTHDARQQVEAHRRERALPQVARALALGDEAPVLRGDRTRIPARSEVVDGAAGNRVAFEDRPFDGGDAAMAWQQRRVIADAAQPRARERRVADARMRVRRDDQVGAVGDRVGRNRLRIFEDVHRHAAGGRRECHTVVRCGRHDLRDVDAILHQRIEHQRTEIP